jgi:hypothetical protein
MFKANSLKKLANQDWEFNRVTGLNSRAGKITFVREVTVEVANREAEIKLALAVANLPFDCVTEDEVVADQFAEDIAAWNKLCEGAALID